MKIKYLVLWVLMLVSPAAFGHRLNEYLQAATISLSRDKVLIQYRLTPGVAVAPAILKGIDADGNGKLSAAEQQAYLAIVAHDISLNVDGHGIALNAIAYTFPTIEEFEKGLGDIIIQYEVKIDTASALHQIQLKNTHYKDTGVYLVNCLLPADTTIHVTGQNRNADQSFYQVNFTTGHVQQGTIRQGSLEKADHQAVIKTYLVNGVRHILGGYDHLLFLCALVLGAAGLWDLVKIVTAFTIAHSITLTLATFGLAHLPELVVEPMIAASIIFVAVQNILWPKQAGGYSRLAIAFFFGLFHGLALRAVCCN